MPRGTPLGLKCPKCRAGKYGYGRAVMGCRPTGCVEGRLSRSNHSGHGNGGHLARTDLLIEGFTYTILPTSLRRSYAGVRSASSAYIETDQNGNGVFDPGIDAQEMYLLAGDGAYPPDPYQTESRHLDPLYFILMSTLHLRLLDLEGCAGGNCK